MSFVQHLHVPFTKFKPMSALLSATVLLTLAGDGLYSRVARAAVEPVVTTVMTTELSDIPGKEALMLTVIYPPGGMDHAHRHHAHAFVYVLEGAIVMGLNGGREVTLKAGQTFYEGLDDQHTVGRNASRTKPAKFVVVLIKERGVPAVLPIF